MNRPLTLFLALMLLLTSPCLSFANEVCPFCGGKLVEVGTITDDPKKPSKNLDVWNRSIDSFYDPHELICSKCWMNYSLAFGAQWRRSSELPDSFIRPLSKTIRQFPVPPAKQRSEGLLVVFSQRFTGAHLEESVWFSCKDLKSLESGFRAYCDRNKLALKIEKDSENHEVRVVATFETDLKNAPKIPASKSEKKED